MRAGREYDRCMAAEMTRQALEAYAAAGGVMTDGGNGYVLGKADTVLGLPLTASMQSVETKAVPFYAMVAHGSIRYAGPALNLSEDPETALLNSVESGAALYYSCVTRLPEELYTTPYARERMPAAFETVPGGAGAGLRPVRRTGPPGTGAVHRPPRLADRRRHRNRL